MNLLKRLNAPFVGSAIAALCFLVVSMLDAAPVGIGLICLIGVVQGALPQHEPMTFVAGILATTLVFLGLGLLFGNSISAGFVMVPFLAAIILLYAIVAFCISSVVTRLWRHVVSGPRPDDMFWQGLRRVDSGRLVFAASPSRKFVTTLYCGTIHE